MSDRLNVQCALCEGTFQSRISAGPEMTISGNYESCEHCGHINEVPSGKMFVLLLRQPSTKGPRNLHYLKGKPYKGSHQFYFPKNKFLLQPSFAFSSNVTHLRSMLELPLELTWMARLFERFKSRGLREMSLEIDATLNKEQRKRLDQRVIAMWSEWFAEANILGRTEFAMRYGALTLNRLSGRHVWRGEHAILTAQLTGLWTVFETLCEDLWIAALNAHPKILAALVGSPSRISAKSHCSGVPTELRVPKESFKPAELERVTGGTYEIKNSMGKILRSQVNFRTLDGIRTAYSVAFSKYTTGVDGVLSRRAIDVLSAVRNVLVHKAGIADAEYGKRIRGLRGAPRASAGKRLPIDGKRVEKIIAPVVEVGKDLIATVDLWIAQH